MVELTKFTAAAVDLDGTLVHTLGDFEAAVSGMLQDLCLGPLQPGVVERAIGKGTEHLVRTVLLQQLLQNGGSENVAEPAAQAVAQLLDGAQRSYLLHYKRVNGAHSSVYAGAEEGLAALKRRGLRLACLTNKPLVYAKDLLLQKGLAHHFEVVFGGDSFEHKKPHPQPLLKTCEALAVMPSQMLMIGDSANDAQAANAAGCGVVLVTYGYNHGQPICDTPALAWLDSLALLVA